MHALTTSFLALCLAHLATDFVLHGDRILVEKRRGRVRAYLEHGGVHFLAAVGLLGLSSSFSGHSTEYYAVILFLTLIHLAIDSGRLRLEASGRISDSARAFVVDQLFHALTIGMAAWVISKTPITGLVLGLSQLQLHAERALVLLVVYVGVIFGGGHLVRYLTKPLFKHDLTIAGETVIELQNAGMYIGWLERFLVLTALMLQSPVTIGLILTAKSIIRYPELKSVRFAEYFLLGTLLSLSLAIVGGLLLLRAFYGTILLCK